MKKFKTVDDIKLRLWNDEIDFFSILKDNFNTWKELSRLLQEKLDWFQTSFIGEFFVEFDKENYNWNIENLDNFFTLREWKLWSRWVWYYGLFWGAYDIENRNNYEKKYKENMNGFWKEYDEYIKTIWELKNNNGLDLLYLDNFRNLILLWNYILVTIEKTDKNNYKFWPIQNLSFKITDIDKIKTLMNELIGIYQQIIDNIINFSLWNKKVNELPNIISVYDKIKNFFIEEKIILTKKWKFSLNDFFKNI